MVMLMQIANQTPPHRSTTTAEKPSRSPTAPPVPSTTARCDRACRNAGLILGGGGVVMANAKTAFKRKQAAVITTMSRMMGMRTGPRRT
jgi:hypothetical protein